MSTTQATPTAVPHLKRVLTLWDLIYYGVVLVLPIAPVPIFGVMMKLSGGHAVTTVLLAMAAMMLTAVSYGRMAALYPAAGSAYTYVGRGLNPHLGFLTGWAMFLDYLIQPIINSIFGTLTIQRFFPHIPFALLAAFFVALFTYLNLRGIRATATTNKILLAVMCTVIGFFVLLAVEYLFRTQGWRGIFSVQPFYARQTFDWRLIPTATSVAALTYIGFDGVTTLAEDVHNPKRNVLLATTLVCLFTGIFGGLQVYLGQRVWPDYHTFPNIETAFMDVTQRVGGPLLFNAMAFTLLVACLGAGLTGQVGAARLLFGMGRDRVLPHRVFAYLDPKRNTPVWNILIIGIIAYVGALTLNFEQAATVLNFGAFLAFMGVNLAAFKCLYLSKPPGGKRHLVRDGLAPAFGFLFCLAIWVSLPLPAKLIGGAWFLVGISYAIVRTRGFRTKPVMIDFTE